MQPNEINPTVTTTTDEPESSNNGQSDQHQAPGTRARSKRARHADMAPEIAERVLAITCAAASALTAPTDDAGHASVMLELYGDRLIYSTALGWLADVGTHWQQDVEHLARRAAVRTLRHRAELARKAGREDVFECCSANNNRVNGVLALYRALVTVTGVESFDTDPDILPVRNGLLYLPTLELIPHDPTWRVTACLDVDFDPAADTSKWERFISDSLTREGGAPDPELLDFFQMAVGYALTGHTREEILLYFFGKPRAGKGTVAEALQTLLGKVLCGWVDFATFTRKRDQGDQGFDLSALRSARLVIASESTRRQSLNPAKIKQLTGGDEISCARKYRDPFTYRPLYKVFLLSNHEVRADPDDDALWGRIRVVRFPNSHLGREDVTLKASFKEPDQQRAILLWAARGAQRYYERGRLPYPDAVRIETARQRKGQDFIGQWVEECTRLDAEAFSSNAALMESYRRYCDAGNYQAVTAQELTDTLVNRFECTRERTKHSRGLRGIALLAPKSDQNGHSPSAVPDAVRALLDGEVRRVES